MNRRNVDACNCVAIDVCAEVNLLLPMTLGVVVLGVVVLELPVKLPFVFS